MAITDDLKLRMYNGALRRLGARSISALTESSESRRVLDGAWGSSDELVRWALEKGEWNFAIRSVRADYNPSITPSFGFQRAFDKPEDFRRLAGLSADAYMRYPLKNSQFTDEATFWFSDYDVLYVRYVSDDTDYGLNGGGWTEQFKELIELKLADKTSKRITNSTSLKREVAQDLKDALRDAKSHDAMQEGVKMFPSGSWASSRRGMGRSGE